MTNLVGDSADPKVPAVVGTNNSPGNDPTTAGRGVVGNSAGGVGVFGQSGAGYGVSGSTNSSYQPGPSGTAGVWGNNAGSGIGVKGTSSGGDAVLGYSSSNAHAGVSAVNDSGGFGLWARGARAGHFEGTVEITGDLNCESRQPNAPAVVGTNNAPGTATTGGRGVVGNSVSGTGVLGQSDSGVAVYGNSRLGNAFYGQSQLGIGIVGESQQPNGPAILGENRAEGGRGVVGNSFTATGIGVLGQNGQGVAVMGNSGQGIGVGAHSDTSDGVHGTSNSPTAAGVSGFNLGTSTPSGPGVLGHSGWGSGVVGDSDHYVGVFGVSHDPAQAGVCGHNPGGLAGFFNGNVTVTGDILLPGADCAEDFDVACSEQTEPGTVMIINPEGALEPSREAYDKKVAGVVSGAGDLRPGIVLDQRRARSSRTPLALVGKVYCKVDACYSPIEVGDLLTTSTTPGHAMKAGDLQKAFGATIGKALRPLEKGHGLIPILIALQ